MGASLGETSCRALRTAEESVSKSGTTRTNRDRVVARPLRRRVRSSTWFLVKSVSVGTSNPHIAEGTASPPKGITDAKGNVWAKRHKARQHIFPTARSKFVKKVRNLWRTSQTFLTIVFQHAGTLETGRLTMRTMLLAATAALTLTAGIALADNGDSFDSNSWQKAPTQSSQPTQSHLIMPNDAPSMVIGHSVRRTDERGQIIQLALSSFRVRVEHRIGRSSGSASPASGFRDPLGTQSRYSQIVGQWPR